MRRRHFGTTDLETSAVGFGTWALGSDWWGEHESPDALVARALEIGVPFFDTADSQAHKESERPHDWSPEHTRRALEASLRRLQTDYVDLYQLHNPRMDGI